jgi:hypothetical protein
MRVLRWIVAERHGDEQTPVPTLVFPHIEGAARKSVAEYILLYHVPGRPLRRRWDL